MDHKESKENCRTNPCPTVKRVESKDNADLKKYIMWENKFNFCWLDASMALVAHNKVMKRYSDLSTECRLSKIISVYDEAISILNDPDTNANQKIMLARAKLSSIQKSNLEFFGPILKNSPGAPESAFCCLYNFLKEDPQIKQIFEITWLAITDCSNCRYYNESAVKKTIVTLSKVDSFDPKNLAVLFNCPKCKSLQKMKLIYVHLPPCLIFHFESGAGTDNPLLSFNIREREYQLTGIMTFEKSKDSKVNHFITWIRDPFVNKWLDCNDLNMDITFYTPDFPDIKFQDVCIYVYESFDDFGTIIDDKVEYKIDTKSNESILCIDLSEEPDSENSSPQKFNKDTGKNEISESNSQANSSSIESSRDKSENSNSQNVSVSNKDTGKMKISASDSQLQGNTLFTEPDRDKSENNSSRRYVLESDQETEKMLISAFASQSNISSVEPGRDKYENSSSLSNTNGSNKDAGKMEIAASDLHLQDNASSIVPRRLKPLEITISAEQAIAIDRQIARADFMQSVNTATTTSETSYVKLSVRKKKCPDVPSHKRNSVNEVNHPDSEEGFNTTNYVPRCSKSVKETKESTQEADKDYVPSGVPKKKQKIKKILSAKKDTINTKEGARNSKAKVKVLKTGLKKSSQVKSKLKNFTSNKICRVKKSSQIKPKLKNLLSKKGAHDGNNNSNLSYSKEEKNLEEHHLYSEQCHSNLGTTSETENSDINSDGDGMVLKEFEDCWSCHIDGCNCAFATFEDTIDTVVDFSLAYIHQLSQKSMKPNFH